MSTQYFHGLNIRWGVGETSSSAFGVNSLIQSFDSEKKVDEVEIKNTSGSTVAWIGYDAKKEATFEYVAATTGTPLGNSTVTMPTQGDLISIISDEASIQDTHWVVKNVVEKAMNTDATKVTVRATLYPNITT